MSAKLPIAGSRILMAPPDKPLELCPNCNQRFYEFARVLHEGGECIGKHTGRRFYRLGNRVVDQEPNQSEDTILCVARSGRAADLIARAMNAQAAYRPALRAKKRREARKEKNA